MRHRPPTPPWQQASHWAWQCHGTPHPCPASTMLHLAMLEAEDEAEGWTIAVDALRDAQPTTTG